MENIWNLAGNGNKMLIAKKLKNKMVNSNI